MEKFVSTMYDAITQGMEKEFPERVAFRYYTEETDMVTTVLLRSWHRMSAGRSPICRAPSRM